MKLGDNQSHSLVLSEDGRKSHDHGCEGRLDVLVSVHHELLHAGQYVVHDDSLLQRTMNFNFWDEGHFSCTIYLDRGVEGLAEVANLVRGCSANLRLAVLQETLQFIETIYYSDLCRTYF